MDSILNSIKTLLGAGSIDNDYFDNSIIIFINTVLAILKQIGYSKKDFTVTDSTATWSDFLNEDSDLELIKSYVYLKVKLLFDPPQTSILVDLTNKQISELESRISILVDNGGIM